MTSCPSSCFHLGHLPKTSTRFFVSAMVLSFPLLFFFLAALSVCRLRLQEVVPVCPDQRRRPTSTAEVAPLDAVPAVLYPVLSRLEKDKKWMKMLYRFTSSVWKIKYTFIVKTIPPISKSLQQWERDKPKGDLCGDWPRFKLFSCCCILSYICY